MNTSNGQQGRTLGVNSSLPQPRENEIGRAGQVPPVQPKPAAERVRQPTHRHLRCGVPAADARHQRRASFRGDPVHAADRCGDRRRSRVASFGRGRPILVAPTGRNGNRPWPTTPDSPIEPDPARRSATALDGTRDRTAAPGHGALGGAPYEEPLDSATDPSIGGARPVLARVRDAKPRADRSRAKVQA